MYIQSTTAFQQGLHDAFQFPGDCCTAGLVQKLLRVLPNYWFLWKQLRTYVQLLACWITQEKFHYSSKLHPYIEIAIYLKGTLKC